jgi:hypothetical protein
VEAKHTQRGFWGLPPERQIAYGCIFIVVSTTAVLYCVGLFSVVIRTTFQRPATPTLVVFPTQVPSATLGPPTLINLPRGTLIATPTQAPIPTRETPTLTPTVDLTNPAPVITGTITGTVRATLTLTGTRGTLTPTRRITTTITITPR